jgi:hypothetical protein
MRRFDEVGQMPMKQPQVERLSGRFRTALSVNREFAWIGMLRDGFHKISSTSIQAIIILKAEARTEPLQRNLSPAKRLGDDFAIP